MGDKENSGSQRPILGPVSSDEELASLVSQISSADEGSMLLFRGQNNLHPTLRSGLARPGAIYPPDVEQGWSALAGNILGHDSVSPRNIPFRKAVLQHYGFKTHYIDLTADFRVAAWFACSTAETRRVLFGGVQIRSFEEVSYSPRLNGLGYILVVALKDPAALVSDLSAFDISTLTPFLRPQRQHAWLLRDRRPLLPDPNDFWVSSISVDCAKFASPLTTSYLFPSPKEDAGFRKLLDLPWVEIPSTWLDRMRQSKEGEDKQEPKTYSLEFGMRALSIPEYGTLGATDEYNHKWNDETLTEPNPMQCWVDWHFNLSDEFPGMQGDIANSTKITLSPRAVALMYKTCDEIPIRWPNLATDELFFTFSQRGHDKIIDIDYPFHGVWLHRDVDLVFEHPMSADEENLSVHAGHVFEFVGQELIRRNIDVSCRCSSPESHESRVRAMMRISALVEKERVILIPHPLRIPNWYFAL